MFSALFTVFTQLFTKCCFLTVVNEPKNSALAPDHLYSLFINAVLVHGLSSGKIHASKHQHKQVIDSVQDFLGLSQSEFNRPVYSLECKCYLTGYVAA